MCTYINVAQKDTQTSERITGEIRILFTASQIDLNKQMITTIVRDHKSKFPATDVLV